MRVRDWVPTGQVDAGSPPSHGVRYRGFGAVLVCGSAPVRAPGQGLRFSGWVVGVMAGGPLVMVMVEVSVAAVMPPDLPLGKCPA